MIRENQPSASRESVFHDIATAPWLFLLPFCGIMFAIGYWSLFGSGLFSPRWALPQPQDVRIASGTFIAGSPRLAHESPYALRLASGRFLRLGCQPHSKVDVCLEALDGFNPRALHGKAVAVEYFTVWDPRPGYQRPLLLSLSTAEGLVVPQSMRLGQLAKEQARDDAQREELDLLSLLLSLACFGFAGLALATKVWATFYGKGT
jgi:hypothetical protein